MSSGSPMDARSAILGKIRRALRVTAEDPIRNAAVEARLNRAPKGVIPARGQLDEAGRVALFAQMAEHFAATTERVADAAAVPAAVAAYLRGHNLPAEIRMGEDAVLNAMPWPKTQIDVRHGPADGRDAVGLSRATAAVAESGTLVMTSGQDNPTTLNFLPETSVVVLEAAAVAGDYESVWATLRKRYGKGVLPRTVNMVTGPSRSADIEQKLQLGAHGPRNLHIIIVG
ncbi:MAG TPA: LUD domain-containing protein [Bauldia sp.]|nr:LUD domain-containing protein [Bauldia sp.]